MIISSMSRELVIRLDIYEGIMEPRHHQYNENWLVTSFSMFNAVYLSTGGFSWKHAQNRCENELSSKFSKIFLNFILFLLFSSINSENIVPGHSFGQWLKYLLVAKSGDGTFEGVSWRLVQLNIWMVFRSMSSFRFSLEQSSGCGEYDFGIIGQDDVYVFLAEVPGATRE